jgi:hypothetical protein
MGHGLLFASVRHTRHSTKHAQLPELPLRRTTALACTRPSPHAYASIMDATITVHTPTHTHSSHPRTHVPSQPTRHAQPRDALRRGHAHPRITH